MNTKYFSILLIVASSAYAMDENTSLLNQNTGNDAVIEMINKQTESEKQNSFSIQNVDDVVIEINQQQNTEKEHISNQDHVGVTSAEPKNRIPTLQQIAIDHIVKNPDRIIEHGIPEVEDFPYEVAKQLARGLQKERVRVKKALSQKNSAQNNAQKLQHRIKYLSQNVQGDATQFVSQLNEEFARNKRKLDALNQLIIHFKSMVDQHEEEVAVTRCQKLKLFLSRHKKGLGTVMGINSAIYAAWWVLFALCIKGIQMLDQNGGDLFNLAGTIGACLLSIAFIFDVCRIPQIARGLMKSRNFAAGLQSFYQDKIYKSAAIFVWLLPVMLTGAIIMPAMLLS